MDNKAFEENQITPTRKWVGNSIAINARSVV